MGKATHKRGRLALCAISMSVLACGNTTALLNAQAVSGNGPPSGSDGQFPSGPGNQTPSGPGNSSPGSPPNSSPKDGPPSGPPDGGPPNNPPPSSDCDQLPDAAPLPQSYSIVELGGWSNASFNSSAASGVSNGTSPLAVGTVQDFSHGTTNYAVLFSQSGITQIATDASATDANRSGQVVGSFVSDSRAFISTGGSVLELGTLGGKTSSASSIDDSGNVVGWSDTASDGAHAFFFDGTTMKDLGDNNGFYSHARKIRRGLVVGELMKSDLSVVGFKLNISDGNMVELSTLGGRNTQATSLSDDACDVVGFSAPGPGTVAPFHAFRLRLSGGAMEDLGTLAANQSSEAESINRWRQVVGSYVDSIDSHRAFVYGKDPHDPQAKEKMFDLRSLADQPSKAKWLSLTNAVGIRDDGSIVGYGITAAGYTRVFYATPN